MAPTHGISSDPGALTRHEDTCEVAAHLQNWPPLATYLRRSEPLLVVFFRGFWCERCQAQMDDLIKNADAFRNLGTRVVGISTDNTDSTQERIQQVARAFPILVDETGELIEAIGLVDPNESRRVPIALPSVFLLDGYGVVRFHYIGRGPDDRPKMELLLLAAERLTTGRQ